MLASTLIADLISDSRFQIADSRLSHRNRASEIVRHRPFVRTIRTAACVLMLAGASAQERPSADLRAEDLGVVRDKYVMKSQAFSPVARQQALVLVERLRASAN